MPCDNDDMNRRFLPHGARAIGNEDFALAFCDDKLVFVPKSAGNGNHYTIHGGPDSGVLDIHETEILASGGKRHRTLFALRRADIPSLLVDTAPMLTALLSLVRPLRLGWMKHRGIGLARGIDLITDEDIAAVTRKRKGRLEIDPQLLQRNIFVPEFLEEVYEFPDGIFALCRHGRRIGTGLKVTAPDGVARLGWVRLRDLSRFGHDWQIKLTRVLDRFAIPPDRYADFPALQR